MSPCKCQFLQQGPEKSMSDDFYCAYFFFFFFFCGGRVAGMRAGIRSSVGMLAAPLDLCTKESVYCLSSYSWETPILVFCPVYTPSFKTVIATNKHSSPILKNHALGIPNTAAIFQNGANKSPVCCLLYILRTLIKISSQETKSSICLSTHVADMCIPSQVMYDCYSHYENKPIQIYRKFYHQKMKMFK